MKFGCFIKKCRPRLTSIALTSIFGIWQIVFTEEAVAADPGIAMMYCYGVEEPGIKDTRTAFHVVMEQTNSDELDGSELLKEEIYDKALWLSTPVIFRVRIFKDVTPLLIEGDVSEIANHLLSSSIPSDVYEETEGVKAQIFFRSLRATLAYESGGEVPTSEINYKPSEKLHERYFDLRTDEDLDVYCEDPFLKR